MAEYEISYDLHSFGAGVIEIEIPQNVLIYLLEIDVSKSDYAKFFDVIVLGDEDILYAGPMSDNLIQILFNSKKNKLNHINIILRPSQNLNIPTTKWYIFNDEINFIVNGVYEVANIEIKDPDLFDDDNFRSEWT